MERDELLVPPPGFVELQDKLEPVYKLQERGEVVNERAYPFVFCRGHIDVSKFVHLIEKGGESLWDEEEHGRTNVKLTRPSHDKWGVRKVMLVYCDDFLKNVYHFPWYNDPAWQDALADVLAVLNVSPTRLVRCLLASMPPGCDIPRHHDTGLWVRYTHRVHVPLITSPGSVNFRVGATETTMKNIRFAQGDVIELNNQAKHAVRNNWDRDRVHLILDYIDEDHAALQARIGTTSALSAPIVLAPGAQLSQTRRTVDLIDNLQTGTGVSSESLQRRRGPAFIIIGAQKCGTTSMYEYLCQHALVIKGKRRETHFFDWRWQAQLTDTKAQLDFYMKFYDEDNLIKYPSLTTGESTPSYLLHYDCVIPRLKDVAPGAKLIVMLRDPVQRAYSQYQMTVDQSGTASQRACRGSSVWAGKSFEGAIADEISALNRAQIGPETSPSEFASRYLPNCPMTHGGHSLLARGMYAVQLEPWIKAFGDKIKVVFLEDLISAGKSGGLQQLLDSVHDHVGLPHSDVNNTAPSNTRQYVPMSDSTASMLRQLYAPHNTRLKALLGRDLPWPDA